MPSLIYDITSTESSDNKENLSAYYTEERILGNSLFLY